MAKVTQNDIINFNELYYKCKNAAQVIRETGFSASTVRKYLIKDYIPQDQIKQIKFDINLIKERFDASVFACENWGELCALSEEEKIQLKEFQKELTV